MINLLHNYTMNINDGFCTFNFKNVLQYTVKNQHFQWIGVMKANSFGLGFTIDVLLRLRNHFWWNFVSLIVKTISKNMRSLIRFSQRTHNYIQYLVNKYVES